MSISGIQTYDLPYDFSQLKTGTLTIGNIKWTPTEIISRPDWDLLTTIPYYSDIPSNFFIYQQKFNLFPIPSSTGNVITFNYKKRVPDLGIADYTTGTISATNNSTTVIGSGTSWLTAFLPSAGNVEYLNLWLQVSAPSGTGTWYKVKSIESATSLTLVNPYQEATITGASFIIGQMPLLLEDFHDVILFDALITYFNTIHDDSGKADEYRKRREEIKEMMDDYVGKKTININLKRQNTGFNPNLFQTHIR